jgi:hypothetical protein
MVARAVIDTDPVRHYFGNVCTFGCIGVEKHDFAFDPEDKLPSRMQRDKARASRQGLQAVPAR